MREMDFESIAGGAEEAPLSVDAEGAYDDPPSPPEEPVGGQVGEEVSGKLLALWDQMAPEERAAFLRAIRGAGEGEER